MAKDREDRYESASKLLEDLNALLDDPTRSTERAKITGPRRKAQRKSGLKVVGWIAAVAVIVAAIAVTVAVTMGGSGGQDKPAAVVDAGVVKPVVVDAAVVVVPIDAVATITFHVETEPAGATIARDGEELCTSPCDVDVVDRDRDVEIRASLDNYEDSVAKVNPLEHHGDTKKQVHIKLKKAAKPVPNIPGVPHAGGGSGHTIHAGSGSGSAAVPGSRTGELQGYPIPPPTAGSGK